MKVIVPGPNRPLTIQGDVCELKVRHPKAGPYQVQWIRTPGTSPREPMPGAIEGARVVFKGSAGFAVETTSSRTGLFTQELKPGKYTVSVTCNGFKPFEQELDVPVQNVPIWLEKRAYGERNVPYDPMAPSPVSDSLNVEFGLER